VKKKKSSEDDLVKEKVQRSIFGEVEASKESTK
jgi:hypothetical protein